jgi:lysophospholipase L1-like esterase
MTALLQYGTRNLLSALVLLSTLAIAVGSPARAQIPFEHGQRVLFLGDSITQDGRYVDLVSAYLWAVYPDRDVKIVNAGLSSETVSGITEPVHPYPRPNAQDRLDNALDVAQPNWVVICYGMNDGIYHPFDDRIASAYRSGYQRILQTIAKYNARVILLTPPVFDAACPAVVKRLSEVKPDEPYGYLRPYEKYDDTLTQLGKILAEFGSLPVVERTIDLHTAMAQFLAAAKQSDPQFVYGDGVHPPLEGHVAMARAVLLGLGEPREKVDHVLAKIAGVRPPLSNAAELPVPDDATEIRELIFVRGRELSAVYRKSIAPQTPREEAQQLLPAALMLADEREQEIRVRLK